MAFKNRRRGKVKVHQKNDAVDSQKIKMSPNTKKKRKEAAAERSKAPTFRFKAPKRKLEVVEGGITARKREKKRSRITAIILLAAAVILVVLHFVTPAGLAETAQNFLVSTGGGAGLPVDLSGDSVGYLNVRGSTALVLTDSHMYAYNQAGREITAVQHGYTSPVLDVSAARTLLYDRGNFRLRVDNLYKNIADVEFENEIITADIADCGYTAVALNDEEFGSVVTVYNKSFDPIFRQSVKTEQVTSVILSPNGRRICLVSAKSNNGDAVSTVRILDTKSGAQLASEAVEGTVLVNSHCNSRRVFLASTDTLVSFKWDGTERLNYDGYTNIRLVNGDNPDRLLVVCNPVGSRECKVAIISRKGEKLAEFSYSGDFSSMCVGKSNVFVYNNATVTALDFEGKQTDTYDIGYGNIRLAAYKRGFIATTDMKLERFE